jgi:arabinose-5-phosphate isomerase
MSDVVVEISAKGFGLAGVVSDGRLVGVITDGDLRRHSANLFNLNADDVMTSGPKVVYQGTLCEDALAILDEHRITALFVTSRGDPETPVGVVNIHDFARMRRGG